MLSCGQDEITRLKAKVSPMYVALLKRNSRAKLVKNSFRTLAFCYVNEAGRLPINVISRLAILHKENLKTNI